MKTAFFEVFEGEEEIFKAGISDEALFFKDKLSEDNVLEIKDVEIISTFINSRINKEVIDNLPNLKFISTRSTGFDHIDITYAQSKGIKVSNVPAYGSHTVAEFAFALLLAVSRKIYLAYDNLRRNSDFSINQLEGFDLFGKTVGVIGTGKIGKNFIKIAKGFSMNIIAYDLYPDHKFAEEVGFLYKSLPEILKESDIISLHTPYTKENHHLLDKEKIIMMKKGAILINTARGELVDTDALVFALNEGIISGAGLDVLEGERDLKEEREILIDTIKGSNVKNYKVLLEDHLLIDLPNVIVTPHIAFYSKEAEGEIIKTTIENINNFKKGELLNLIK